MSATGITVAVETVRNAASLKVRTLITVSNGHRTVVIEESPGDKLTAVAFCGASTDAPVARKFAGRMWQTRRGVMKAACEWLAEGAAQVAA